jgi:hypothetical protein
VHTSVQGHSEAERGTESGAILDLELLTTTMFGMIPKRHRVKDWSRSGMRVGEIETCDGLDGPVDEGDVGCGWYVYFLLILNPTLITLCSLISDRHFWPIVATIRCLRSVPLSQSAEGRSRIAIHRTRIRLSVSNMSHSEEGKVPPVDEDVSRSAGYLHSRT